MLISYNWLKKFVNLKQSAQTIAEKITLSLAEVEAIRQQGDDNILQIENKGLTHRGDCFSHLGIAREVAAFCKLKLHDPQQALAKKHFQVARKLPLTIRVQAKKLCPRYCGVVLTDLKVHPSPNWLQTKLRQLGQKPINNIVDITNYVMFELGQPLHAFDYSKVANHHIVVRKSHRGEKLVTLDGKLRKLDAEMLVIADSAKPIGLAGIKGGLNTEIDRHTKTIILEAAKFDPLNNRQTSKKINLRTEAVTRFEKNLDITLPPLAIKRAIELLEIIAQAKVASQIIDIQNQPLAATEVKVRTAWINSFIGFNLTTKQMVSLLKRLGFVLKLHNGWLTVKVPSWRQDIALPADIAEEVARIYGYDKIPATLPQETDKPAKTNLPLFWRKKAKLFLKGAGFTEIHTPPFIGKELLEKYGLLETNHLQLVNPLTVKQKFLRRSLIPSLLEVAKANLQYQTKLKIFEINRIFIPQNTSQPAEIVYLTGIMTNTTFLQMKGVVEVLLEELGLRQYKFKPCSAVAAEVLVGNDVIGKLQKKHGTPDMLLFNLNFHKLSQYATTAKQFSPLPKYPPLIEDLTFTLPDATYIGFVLATIKQQSRLIKTVTIRDRYKNNFTFRITYQSRQHSLGSGDVKIIRQRLIDTIEKKFTGKLRA